MRRRQSIVFIVIASLCILLFTGFSWYVKRGGFKDTDFATTVKLQERIDKSSRLRLAAAVGEVMEGSTFFASPGVSVVAVLALAGFAAYDRKNKKIRWRAAGIFVFFFLLVMAEIYGKSVVHHPAPPFFMIKNPTTHFPKYYINEEFSYPSGHAARAVFIAVLFTYLMGTKRKTLLWSVAGGYVVLVCISRVYLGHHWLSDIIGGGTLGLGTVLFSLAMLSASLPTQKASDQG